MEIASLFDELADFSSVWQGGLTALVSEVGDNNLFSGNTGDKGVHKEKHATVEVDNFTEETLSFIDLEDVLSEVVVCFRDG